MTRNRTRATRARERPRWPCRLFPNCQLVSVHVVPACSRLNSPQESARERQSAVFQGRLLARLDGLGRDSIRLGFVAHSPGNSSPQATSTMTSDRALAEDNDFSNLNLAVRRLATNWPPRVGTQPGRETPGIHRIWPEKPPALAPALPSPGSAIFPANRDSQWCQNRPPGNHDRRAGISSQGRLQAAAGSGRPLG